jgi:hypothetical protein
MGTEFVKASQSEVLDFSTQKCLGEKVPLLIAPSAPF